MIFNFYSHVFFSKEGVLLELMLKKCKTFIRFCVKVGLFRCCQIYIPSSRLLVIDQIDSYGLTHHIIESGPSTKIRAVGFGCVILFPHAMQYF